MRFVTLWSCKLLTVVFAANFSFLLVTDSAFYVLQQSSSLRGGTFQFSETVSVQLELLTLIRWSADLCQH